MIYIGNYERWIKDEWIEYLLNHDGVALHTAIPNCDQEVWDLNSVSCFSYKKENLPFNLELPVMGLEYTNFKWWFVKYGVGMMQLVHQDAPIKDGLEVRRYWMPLQDYRQGHIFWYEDELIWKYKKGDVFQFKHQGDWQGGGNMGHSTRLTFNFTIWNEINR
jgi:hypothetical protein